MSLDVNWATYIHPDTLALNDLLKNTIGFNQDDVKILAELSQSGQKKLITLIQNSGHYIPSILLK